MADRFAIRGEAADSVAEYLRYRQIVRDADGGKMFTPAEYEAFKAERGIVDTSPARAVAPKQPSEEEVMAIYEQRYQARRKAEKAALRPGERERPKHAVALNMPPMHLLDLINDGELDGGGGPAPRMPWDVDLDQVGDHPAAAAPAHHSHHSGIRGQASGEGAAAGAARGATAGQPRRAPADPPEVGDCVAVASTKRGVDAESGVLRFLGETAFADGLWAGVELDDDNGKNDGVVDGVRYFECAPGHGLFVRPSRVSREGGLPPSHIR